MQWFAECGREKDGPTVVVPAAGRSDPLLGLLEVELAFLLLQLLDVLGVQHPLLPAGPGSCAEQLQRRQPCHQPRNH